MKRLIIAALAVATLATTGCTTSDYLYLANEALGAYNEVQAENRQVRQQQATNSYNSGCQARTYRISTPTGYATCRQDSMCNVRCY